MADEADKPTESAAEVRESIEAKPTGDDNAGDNKDHSHDDDASKMDIDTGDATTSADVSRPVSVPNVNANPNPSANADEDVDAEGEVDADGEPEEERVPGRLDHNMMTVIENTANYLSTYKEDG